MKSKSPTLFSLLVAALVLGLVDADSCFVVHDQKCPNENVTFWLYSRSTRDAPVVLNPLELRDSDFQPKLPITILIHGYTGDHINAPNDIIRPVLLDKENVYVISVDYGPLVRYPCYTEAVKNVPAASRCLGQLINKLVERQLVDQESIHVIGFSLGGQVAGQTANYVTKKLKRITGLDPSKPLFVRATKERFLDKGDAEFVDVIHTDPLGRGQLRSVGHVDFYPNFGVLQPGCQRDYPIQPGTCNHIRAPYFYAESISSPKGFWARKCSNWLLYLLKSCPNDENLVLMGHNVSKETRGTYFLTTDNKQPYALGKEGQVDNVILADLQFSQTERFKNYELELLKPTDDLKENDVQRIPVEYKLNFEEKAARNVYWLKNHFGCGSKK